MSPTDTRSLTETGSTTAMASTVRITAVAESSPDEVAGAVADALGIFHVVEANCSRFLPESALSRANAQPDRWHRVPHVCFSAVGAAWSAYRATGGRFDPRVLGDLTSLGYSSWPPAPIGEVRARSRRPDWHPRFLETAGRVHLGGWPVDLGGIGKGLTVRWASQSLRFAAPDHLLDAGGDCYGAGCSPDGGPWRIGVEDPAGGDEPVAVLGLVDQACATTSVRLRQWTAGGRRVHHIVDPDTGLPGGRGLQSVSVVGPDPAWAEVWSKVLFLEGADGIAAAADRHQQAACWVTTGGGLGASAALAPVTLWRR